MNLSERATAYNTAFPKFSKQAPVIATDRWLFGVWIIGNNYQNAMGYYGEYPPTYLKRIYSLFPEIQSNEILHLFSGSLDPTEKGLRFDINPDLKPDYCGNAENLSQIIKDRTFKLILADPPYSSEDAEHYGQCLVNRNKVVKECESVLEIGGYLVWLDQVLPMYRKDEIQLIGTINVIRSTNHRVRDVFIWEKLQKAS